MYIQKHPEEAPNLNIDFTAIVGGHGGAETVELIPNGENIQVDQHNYSEYIIRFRDLKFFLPLSCCFFLILKIQNFQIPD